MAANRETLAFIIAILLFGLQIMVMFMLFGRAKASKPIDRIIKDNQVQTDQLIKKKKKKTNNQWLAGIMKRANLHLSSTDVVLYGLLLMVVALALGYVLSGTLVGGILLVVLTDVGLVVWVKRRIDKRLKAFEAQLGDAIQVISNAMKAGYSFFQAMSRVVDESKDPLAATFKQAIKEMSLGISTEQAMVQIAEQNPIEDLELLVNAILIQREIGGNLAEILDNILNTIRERQRIANEVRTLTAQGKLSGLIIMLMPIFLGIALFFFNRSYMMLLFTTTPGRIMVGVSIVNQIIGALMIRKIIDVTY